MQSQKERAAEDQRKQIKKLFDLYLAGHKELGFFGKAGVGKTYCADILARLIASTMPRKPNIIAVATVHKAVELLADKFRYSSTLASFLAIKAIYDKQGRLQFVPTNSYNKEGRTASDYDIIIVDECSMITKDNLKLLREKVREDAVIIYLGDWRQTCPPDSDNSEDSLTFDIPAHVNLNIPFRYEGGLSDMNDYIGDMIEVIKTNKKVVKDPIKEYVQIKKRLREYADKYPDNIKITNLEDAYKSMANLDESFLHNHLVSYRNKTNYEINGAVRNVVKKLKGLTDSNNKFIIGDKVYTKEALSKYSLHPEFKKLLYSDKRIPEGFRFFEYGEVGDFPPQKILIVEGVKEYSFYVTVAGPPSKKELHFTDKKMSKDSIKIEGSLLTLQKDGGKITVFSIYPTLKTAKGNPYKTALNIIKYQCEELKARKTTWYRLKRKNRKDVSAWAEMYNFKNSIVDLNFGYALNTYLVQGQTLEEVFVNVRDIFSVAPTTWKAKLQSLYTACTRASDVVHLIL